MFRVLMSMIIGMIVALMIFALLINVSWGGSPAGGPNVAGLILFVPVVIGVPVFAGAITTIAALAFLSR